jgi:hypothetical protein
MHPKNPGKVPNLFRQAFALASTIILLSITLGTFLNSNWFYFSFLPAAGLLFSAISGYCPMTFILSKMPWNKHNRANPR